MDACNRLDGSGTACKRPQGLGVCIAELGHVQTTISSASGPPWWVNELSMIA